MLVANTVVAPGAGVKLPCSQLSAAHTARTGISCPCYDLLLGTKTESPPSTYHTCAHTHAFVCCPKKPTKKTLKPLSAHSIEPPVNDIIKGIQFYGQAWGVFTQESTGLVDHQFSSTIGHSCCNTTWKSRNLSSSSYILSTAAGIHIIPSACGPLFKSQCF